MCHVSSRCALAMLPLGWSAIACPLRRFFDEISQDTGKFVFGMADTLQCLEMGAVEVLIVWENLEVCHALASRRAVVGGDEA